MYESSWPTCVGLVSECSDVVKSQVGVRRVCGQLHYERVYFRPVKCLVAGGRFSENTMDCCLNCLSRYLARGGIRAGSKLVPF